MYLKRGLTVCIPGGLLGALLLAGCASTAPPPAAVTVTASPSTRVVTFNPATSGKVLAARIALRAKPKKAGETITGVVCKNFANLRVGTHTDCQMRLNGVKRGLLVTFTRREGHYLVTSQSLTW
jgi:hypothetical protein